MGLLRYIADDLLKDLKQTYDDKEIELTQVVYWIIMVSNELRGKHIQNRNSGAFLSTFTGVTVETESVTNRKYVTLPGFGIIYDFNNDRGVDYMSYTSDGSGECAPRFTRTPFQRTAPAISHRLYLGEDSYEKPTPKNPYFYRVHRKLYLLGIERIDVPTVEIGLYMTLDPVTDINIDDDFDFPDELIYQVKRRILDMGRFALLIPQERLNDGAAEQSKAIPTNKIVSVNDQQQQQ